MNKSLKKISIKIFYLKWNNLGCKLTPHGVMRVFLRHFLWIFDTINHLTGYFRLGTPYTLVFDSLTALRAFRGLY
jgi:hypothetical protein